MHRTLDDISWSAVQSALDAQPRSKESEVAAYERLRFLCALLYYLAPKVSEIVGSQFKTFSRIKGVLWWRASAGAFPKGHVRVPPPMEEALIRYETYLKEYRRDLVGEIEGLPLLHSASRYDPITGRQLNLILKALFRQAAATLPKDAFRQREQLMHASAQWLRHTAIRAVADAGADALETQTFARHAKRESTAPYLRDDPEEIYREAQSDGVSRRRIQRN